MYQAMYAPPERTARAEWLGKYETLQEAQVQVAAHAAFKKTYFNKRGNATPKNPNQNEYFRVWDTVDVLRHYAIY